MAEGGDAVFSSGPAFPQKSISGSLATKPVVRARELAQRADARQRQQARRNGYLLNLKRVENIDLSLTCEPARLSRPGYDRLPSSPLAFPVDVLKDGKRGGTSRIRTAFDSGAEASPSPTRRHPV